MVDLPPGGPMRGGQGNKEARENGKQLFGCNKEWPEQQKCNIFSFNFLFCFSTNPNWNSTSRTVQVGRGNNKTGKKKSGTLRHWSNISLRFVPRCFTVAIKPDRPRYGHLFMMSSICCCLKETDSFPPWCRPFSSLLLPHCQLARRLLETGSRPINLSDISAEFSIISQNDEDGGTEWSKDVSGKKQTTSSL